MSTLYFLHRARRAAASILLALALHALSSAAATPAEEAEAHDFSAAMLMFQEGFAEYAETQFADFARAYTNSSRAAQAVLMQARAAFQLKKTEEAIQLLTGNLSRAGADADEYHFWLAQIRLDNGDFRPAAGEFALLLKSFPKSVRRLEAAYGEAYARFKLQEWPAVVELLNNPAGPFQQAAAGAANDDLVARGRLLLVEALVEQNQFAAAAAAVDAMPVRTGELAWQRQYVLCRIQLADGKPGPALANTTNLVTLALASRQPALQARSFLLQGAILEQLKQPEAALEAYEHVQAESMPADKRRQALLESIELHLTLGQTAEAVRKLESFRARYPQDAGAEEVVLLSLGEVRLRQHLSSASSEPPPGAAPLTNSLAQALAAFETFLRDYPRSRYLGQAQLNRGWCLWLDGKSTDSQAAFKAAAEALPRSMPQAVARFKLAETHFAQGDPTNALKGYQALLSQYASMPVVKEALFDRALYQIVRIGIQTGATNTSRQAMRQIMDWFPSSLYSQQSLFLYGQTLNESNSPAQAREVFAQFLSRFPGSDLRPEVELAVARSYELEADWTAAMTCYDTWVVRHPALPSTPVGEFCRASSRYRAGQESNAFVLFTNFVALHPTNALGARARDWIGDYHFRHGDFKEAERHYQLLFQNTNWPVTELTFLARLKAGRAAFLNQSPKDATNYFADLININDRRCSSNLLAEALFAHGDTLVNIAAPDATNALLGFSVAKAVFEKIPQLYPASPLVPRAWGRIGDCWFQLASRDPRCYTNACESYRKSMLSPAADPSTRAQAGVGLGNALLRQAMLGPSTDTNMASEALRQYLAVVNDDRSPADLFWVKEAGLAALRVVEGQKRWREAFLLCDVLRRKLPALAPGLEKKMAQAREQMELGRN